MNANLNKGYSRIRIDKDVIIKVPTRTGGTGEGSLYLFFAETFDSSEKPLETNGEMAEALRAWIAGTRNYPVTDNGILDIYGHIVEGLTASRALDGEVINWPLDLSSGSSEASTGALLPGANPAPLPMHNSPVPVVDVEKVARAIKERK